MNVRGAVSVNHVTPRPPLGVCVSLRTARPRLRALPPPFTGQGRHVSSFHSEPPTNMAASFVRSFPQCNSVWRRQKQTTPIKRQKRKHPGGLVGGSLPHPPFIHFVPGLSLQQCNKKCTGGARVRNEVRAPGPLLTLCPAPINNNVALLMALSPLSDAHAATKPSFASASRPPPHGNPSSVRI